jgi:hypothetical protein
MSGASLATILLLTALISPVDPLLGEQPSGQSKLSDNETQSRPVFVHDGFITGQEFRKMSEDLRRSYAMGIIDGMLLAPLFGARTAKTEWIDSCVVGMSDEQVTAIIMKYLERNPARWHERLHTTVYSAMIEACPRSPGKTR